MNLFRTSFLILCAASALTVEAQSPIGLLPDLDVENYDGALELQIGGHIRTLDAAGRLEAERELLDVAMDSEASLAGRRMACRSLLLCPSEVSAADLAPLLADPDMAHYARAVIEVIPGDVADQVLINALNETEGPLWLGVVDSLGVRKSAAAVEPMAIAAAGDDVERASAGIRALGAIGDVRSFAALSQLDVDGQLDVLRVESILNAAQNLVPRHEYLPAVAAEMKRFVGDDQSPAVRVAAYRLLIQSQPDKAAGIIVDLLSSKDSVVRKMGASALDLVGSDENLKQVLTRWNDLPGESKARVLTFMRTEGRFQVLKVARATLNDESMDARVSAIETIGRFGSSADLKTLFALIKEGGVIEEIAVGAISSLPDTKVDAKLIAEFRRESSPVRSQLAGVFPVRNDIGALPVLLDVAAKADGRFRANIYRAIGSLGGSDLVPVLLERRSASDSSARLSIERAVVAIGRRLDDGQVVSMLIASWPGSNEDENASVIRMVGAIGDSAGLAFLIPLANEASPNAVVLDALCRWKTADVLPTLKGIVERKDLSDGERRSAWQGILRLNMEFGWQHRDTQIEWAGVLLETAMSNDDRLRAFEAFGQLNNPLFIEFLEQWISDPELGDAARAAQESVKKRTEG